MQVVGNMRISVLVPPRPRGRKIIPRLALTMFTESFPHADVLPSCACAVTARTVDTPQPIAKLHVSVQADNAAPIEGCGNASKNGCGSADCVAAARARRAFHGVLGCSAPPWRRSLTTM
jgi:hypothetical protein